MPPLGGAFTFSCLSPWGILTDFCLLWFSSRLSRFEFETLRVTRIYWQAFTVTLSKLAALSKVWQNELMIFLLLCGSYIIWTNSPWFYCLVLHPGFMFESPGSFLRCWDPTILQRLLDPGISFIKISPGVWDLQVRLRTACLVGALYKFYFIE